MPQPSASPSPSVRPSATPRRAIRATRVVVPSLRIDLPVVSSDLEVPGNRDAYPLCDVAQYLSGYDQPNREGITYIYGHARAKMFLPLLLTSQRDNGADMIGALVQVYTNEPRAYLYEITRLRRHATALARQDALKPGERVLYLQTSEGPHGTVPKLQVVARLLASEPARAPVAMPTPKPRACPP